MQRILILSVLFSMSSLLVAWGHPGHDSEELKVHSNSSHDTTKTLVARNKKKADSVSISGQGKLKFRVLHTSDHLPSLAASVLKKAHGGFAVDRREGRGEIYFALPEAGILQISSDFSLVRMLNASIEIRETNMHNTTIWFDAEGNGYLAFPANDAGKLITTTLDGRPKHTLLTPGPDMHFEAEKVNAYFRQNKKFVPTDIEYVDGKYFVTTGYSALDYVLTAELSVTKPDPNAPAPTDRRARRRGPQGPTVSAAWTPLAFGGKGAKPGQFGTGHGITLLPDGETLIVADRPNSELETFSQDGTYLDRIQLPKGSFPCDVDFEAGYAVVGCLHGPDRDKGAPIYILKDDKVVSTIMPKEDLGLENFQHIHNAVLIERDGILYVIAQAWNPGDFAILQQVVD